MYQKKKMLTCGVLAAGMLLPMAPVAADQGGFGTEGTPSVVGWSWWGNWGSWGSWGDNNDTSTSTSASPKVSSHNVTFTNAGAKLTAKVDNAAGKKVTFRASATKFGTQTGFYEQAYVDSSGNVSIEISDFNHQNTRYWQLEDGGSYYTHGTVLASGSVSASNTTSTGGSTTAPSTSTPSTSTPSTSTPSTSTPSTSTPSTGSGSTTGGTAADPSNGKGGAFTDRTFVSYTAAGKTGQYHIYAKGIDTSKPVGVVYQFHGDGGYEFKNPSYKLPGLNQHAKNQNMIFVSMKAPNTQNVWWNDIENNGNYARALIQNEVLGKYNIDKSRTWMVGYSGGAEFISYEMMQEQNDLYSGGGAIMFGGGGAPGSFERTPSASLKKSFVPLWYTGLDDDLGNSDPGWSAIDTARKGMAFYKNAGFVNASLTAPAGIDHFEYDEPKIFGQQLSKWAAANPASTTPTTTAPAPAPAPKPTTSTPAPTTSTPAPSTSTAPKVSSHKVTYTSKGATITAKVDNAQGKLVTFRTSAYKMNGQTGFYNQAYVDANGNVSMDISSFTHTNPRYWQLELGGSYYTHGSVLASGVVSSSTATNTGGTPTTTAPAPKPTTSTPAPAPAPAPNTSTSGAGDFTNGKGGALTNRTSQSFSSSGVSGKYHIYAAGLDWSKPVGIMVYGDGSGEYGLKNPSSSYLMGGTNGLINVAKKHNLLLVTPMAPGGDCPDGGGVCWYQSSGGYSPAQKAQWSADLVQNIYGQYNIDKERFVFGGYSSGAQWTTEFFGPAHADRLGTKGVGVAISYGGRPISTPNYSAAHKANFPMVWDTGSADSAYTTSGAYGVKGGESWYRSNGFKTQLHVNSGMGHSRSDFGKVMDREITEHVKPAR